MSDEEIAQRFSKHFTVWGIPECELRGYVSHCIRQKYRSSISSYSEAIGEHELAVRGFISGDLKPTKKILDSIGMVESTYYSPR